MKKIFAIAIALALILSLSTRVRHHPGVWGETNYGYTQPVERTIRYDYDGGWIIVRSGWRWQNSVVLRDLILSYL